MTPDPLLLYTSGGRVIACAVALHQIAARKRVERRIRIWATAAIANEAAHTRAINEQRAKSAQIAASAAQLVGAAWKNEAAANHKLGCALRKCQLLQREIDAGKRAA
jgi:hypothetical protein